MPTDVLMPKLADTLVEGTVTRWFKAVNDAVQVGEALAEIETDKVTTELTAPITGTLSELLVAVGQTVPIGTPLARIRAQDELGPHPLIAARTPLPQSSPLPRSSLLHGRGEGEKRPPAAAPSPLTAQFPPPLSPFPGREGGRGVRSVTPLAARLANAHGINLEDVRTSSGRITRADVERHLVQLRQPQTIPQPVRAESERRGTEAGELRPLTGLRRATAVRMAAVRQVPTGKAIVEADVTPLVRAYQRERGPWLGREGFPLTYTPYFVYALAQSLRAWPAARATLRDGEYEPRDEVHVGVAVATKEGLMVPVVTHADQQDIAALARTLGDLVARARARRLRAHEVTGGVATVTNVGSLSGLLALPMLNEHQATILGVGTVNRRAVGDRHGIHYRYRVYLSLTFDRRLLDDLQAERFLLHIAQVAGQNSWT